MSGQTVACGFISTKQHSDFIISPNYSLIQHSPEKWGRGWRAAVSEIAQNLRLTHFGDSEAELRHFSQCVACIIQATELFILTGAPQRSSSGFALDPCEDATWLPTKWKKARSKQILFCSAISGTACGCSSAAGWHSCKKKNKKQKTKEDQGLAGAKLPFSPEMTERGFETVSVPVGWCQTQSFTVQLHVRTERLGFSVERASQFWRTSNPAACRWFQSDSFSTPGADVTTSSFTCSVCPLRKFAFQVRCPRRTKKK